MNLFGKKKEAPKLNDSIAALRSSMSNLEKREKFLEKQIGACVAEAKKRAKGKDKKGALFQIRRKKMFEKQIDQIYGKRVNLETQIMALEEASNSKEVFNAMKTSNNALKSSIKEQDIDKVDDVMEEINASIGLVDEVSSAMSQPIGLSANIDEDELEAELNELEDEDIDQDEIELRAPINKNNKVDLNLPSAGVGKPQRKVNESDKEREERELKELEELA